ncbi:hypothetical protein PoB_004297900 [Plakobranchus ocellatus]|uniref:Uncharacterized protein n=1 Tax=Plakobranchus ocellatus TaxID=259542 RepID=A0AAV4B8P2_9GAST|nr:hypothetical protein PoB_004297900 [Plakobranchus ocellatus]
MSETPKLIFPRLCDTKPGDDGSADITPANNHTFVEGQVCRVIGDFELQPGDKNRHDAGWYSSTQYIPDVDLWTSGTQGAPQLLAVTPPP